MAVQLRLQVHSVRRAACPASKLLFTVLRDSKRVPSRYTPPFFPSLSFLVDAYTVTARTSRTRKFQVVERRIDLRRHCNLLHNLPRILTDERGAGDVRLALGAVWILPLTSPSSPSPPSASPSSLVSAPLCISTCSSQSHGWSTFTATSSRSSPTRGPWQDLPRHRNRPSRSARGLLYAKLTTLTLAAVLIPLATPRVHPRWIPRTRACRHQSRQLPLSLILFSFLDPVIWDASRQAHLSLDELPPLCGQRRGGEFESEEFQKYRYVFGCEWEAYLFGIIKTFRSEFATIIALLLLYVAAPLPRPSVSTACLPYLEGETDSDIRPIVWILWLALGPLTGTVALQAYYWLCASSCKLKGLLTELIFEHALRVRVKAQNVDADADATPTASGSGSTDGASSADGTASSTKKAGKTAPKKEKDENAQTAINVGQISNLVTTDLRNVTNMADFLQLVFYLPVTVVFCVVFLWVVLGWRLVIEGSLATHSAFVGMFTMAMLFPLSAFAARLLQHIQKGADQGGGCTDWCDN
ncbi:ATP-binding cassette transporter [Mycena sanguinolenta]|uniref:ATP-binding cassette transporter n=1 Tax=Mycena sanguinolenta TaxID=230812 RepID=A0A8H6Y841_9AGAR|nr:ATP-binding cassette transporter [Mycena sanguinolenta]